ncbi:putative amino acid permease, partial [Termitomyces sp. T112]
MSSTSIVDFLTKQIFIERNVVTYRSLSRELRLHVNTAKNELAIYHENAPYRSQTSYATYLVCGEIDPHYADDLNMDYGEGKDVDGDFEDDGDDVPQVKLLLVNEPDLEDAKSQFTRINSIHVYSLSPSPLRDAGHICTPTEHVRAADRGKDAKEMIKIVGKIVGANIKIVPSTSKAAKLTRQPVAGPSRSKPSSRSAPAEERAETKEQERIIADKPKDKPKATGKLDFFSKVKTKEKKPDASTEVAKGKGEKEIKEELKENKEKEKQVSVNAQQSKEATEPVKRGKKRKSTLQVSDSEAERPPKVVSRHASPLPNAKDNVRVKGRALISDDEEDEVTKPVRKPRKGRAAAAVDDSDNEEVLAMMDIDDDQVTRISRSGCAGSKVDKEQSDEEEEEEEEEEGEEEEKKPAAVDEDVEMDNVIVPKAKPKKRAPKKVIPVGKNGLKKRRVVKSRSRVDEKGYMVFEDYSEYESVDEEEEPESARTKGKAKAKAKAKAKTEQESEDESVPAAKPKPNTKAAVQKGGRTGSGGAKG